MDCNKGINLLGRLFIPPMAFLLFSLTVHAQTEEQREASVCINVSRLGDDGIYCGSGTIIGLGTVLTAAHVARGVDEKGKIFDTPAATLNVRTIEGTFPGVEKFVDIANDIAIIKADLPETLDSIKLASASPKPGDKCSMLTRGGMTPERSKCHVKNGECTRKIVDGNRVYKCKTQHGDSGSCLLNEQGEIVAVVSVCIGDMDDLVETINEDVFALAGNECSGPNLESIKSLVAQLESAK